MAVLDEIDRPNGLDIRDELVNALAEITRSRRAFVAAHFGKPGTSQAAEQDGSESQTKRSFFKHRNKDRCDE